MAGKRQHFLPRFLLKGFSSRSKGNELYTWVFRRDSKPYETNIQNVGLEGFFYGDPQESSVDDDITEREQSFISMVESLRAESNDIRIGDEAISDFVIHLIVRTQNARKSMLKVGDCLMEIFKRNFTDPSKLEKMILGYVRNNPQEFKQSIEQSVRSELEKRGIRKIAPEVLDALVAQAMRQAPQLLGAKLHDFASLTHFIAAFVQKDLPKIARKSHLRALSEDVVPPLLVEKLSHFRWSLLVQQPNSLILGDIGPIAGRISEARFKAFLWIRDEVEQILLPISDKHLVFGSATSEVERPDSQMVNIAGASLSMDFYVAPINTDTFASYQNNIGSNASPFSEDELREMELSLIREILGTGEPDFGKKKLPS